MLGVDDDRFKGKSETPPAVVAAGRVHVIAAGSLSSADHIAHDVDKHRKLFSVITTGRHGVLGEEEQTKSTVGSLSRSVRTCRCERFSKHAVAPFRRQWAGCHSAHIRPA